MRVFSRIFATAVLAFVPAYSKAQTQLFDVDFNYEDSVGLRGGDCVCASGNSQPEGTFVIQNDERSGPVPDSAIVRFNFDAFANLAGRSTFANSSQLLFGRSSLRLVLTSFTSTGGDTDTQVVELGEIGATCSFAVSTTCNASRIAEGEGEFNVEDVLTNFSIRDLRQITLFQVTTGGSATSASSGAIYGQFNGNIQVTIKSAGSPERVSVIYLGPAISGRATEDANKLLRLVKEIAEDEGIEVEVFYKIKHEPILQIGKVLFDFVGRAPSEAADALKFLGDQFQADVVNRLFDASLTSLSSSNFSQRDVDSVTRDIAGERAKGNSVVLIAYSSTSAIANAAFEGLNADDREKTSLVLIAPTTGTNADRDGRYTTSEKDFIAPAAGGLPPNQPSDVQAATSYFFGQFGHELQSHYLKEDSTVLTGENGVSTNIRRALRNAQ